MLKNSLYLPTSILSLYISFPCSTFLIFFTSKFIASDNHDFHPFFTPQLMVITEWRAPTIINFAITELVLTKVENKNLVFGCLHTKINLNMNVVLEFSTNLSISVNRRFISIGHVTRKLRYRRCWIINQTIQKCYDIKNNKHENRVDIKLWIRSVKKHT